MAPEISVVVPCRNAAATLEATLRSLADQTLAPREIIVVDDGSTDESAAVARGFGPPVRVLSQPHEGAGRARLAGVAAAATDLVAFNDADDPAPPEKLATLAGVLVDHPECVAAFGLTHNPRMPERSIPDWCEGRLDGRSRVVTNPLAELLASSQPLARAMNLAARRADVIAACGDRPFPPAANDYDLQLRLARRGPFAEVARITAQYLSTPESIGATFGAARQMAHALLAAESVYAEVGDRSELEGPWRTRVERDWPMIAVELAGLRDWSLLGRVLGVAARHGRWRSVPGLLARALARGTGRLGPGPGDG